MVFEYTIANFPLMDTLELTRVKNGKWLLLISLILLAVLRLALAVMLQNIVKDTVAFDQFNEVYWWMVPVLALMGTAVFRGERVVRYILCGLLTVALVLEVYLFASVGFPDTIFMVLSILTWVNTLFLIYVVMLNNQTEEFFLFQRSRNFGELAVVENKESRSPRASEDHKKQTPAKRKKIGETKDWDDELDLFE